MGTPPAHRTTSRDSAYLSGSPDDPVSGDFSDHPSPARPQPPRAPSGSRGPKATRGPRAGGGHRAGCGTRAGPWGSPPVLSLSGFPGLSEPWGGTRGRLERARDAGPRGERGAHGRSHRALSLRSRRAPLRPAGLEGAWPSRRRGRGRGVRFPGLGSRPHPAHSRRGAPGEQVAGTREALDGHTDRSIDFPGTLLHPRLCAPNLVHTNFAHPFPMFLNPLPRLPKTSHEGEPLEHRMPSKLLSPVVCGHLRCNLESQDARLVSQRPLCTHS